VDDELTTIPPLHLGSSAWAIRQEVLPRLIEAHRTGLPGWHAAVEQLATHAATPRIARRGAGTRAGGAVAVLPLTGVITPRGSFISMLFGGGCGGLQGFREDFRDAVASPDVGAIVIDVDSPGGLIDLVPETALEIREARGSKPIIAVANTTAASAAYWIAAQADELVVTPSGTVGSVGVYMVHEDWSGWNEKQGIDPTYISAGRFKTEGNPDEPLDEAAQADWQAEVDELYAMFLEAVATGRNISAQDVRDNYGEGRILLASSALDAGMVDRIEPLEAVIGELLAPGAKSSAKAGRLASLTTIRAASDGTDDQEQPRCRCGRWIDSGETQCEDCKASDDEDDEDGQKPDEDEDDQDEDKPKALNADTRAAHAALLFGS
jgi:signal peptide peptidase SppA